MVNLVSNILLVINFEKSNMRTVLFLQLLYIILLLNSACVNREQIRENRTVFRYNESKGISSLDPAFARNQTIIWPVNQLFNGLVQMDDNLNIRPCIAHRWEISDNGKVYTFFLRDDVLFHDHKLFSNRKGRRVIADDFVYSFNRITDPSVASPGAWIFNNLRKDRENNYAGFKALNDSTFQIHLARSFPSFLGLLTMQYCSVIPKEIVEYYGDDFRNNPVGTGPFFFKNWQESEKLVFLNNPHYFERDSVGRRLPYLDAVSITFINDKQSEFLEFIKGNIDFISGVHPSYKDELLTRGGNLNPKYSDQIRLLTQPYLNTEYLGFLMDTFAYQGDGTLVKSRQVRKAINYGFDREKMMKYLRNNLGTPATAGFIPKGLPSFSFSAVEGYDFNPEKARRLLIDAGFPGGEGLPEIVLTTTSDYRDLCEYIQHEVSKIGIKLQVEVSTGASFRNDVANSRLPFFRGSWIADYPDAENYLALFYSPNFSPGGPNYTHYQNSEYDRLYEAALGVVDDNRRFMLYREMDQIIMDDAVVVPLFYDQVVRFVQKNIQGFNGNPMNLLVLKKVKKIN